MPSPTRRDGHAGRPMQCLRTTLPICCHCYLFNQHICPSGQQALEQCAAAPPSGAKRALCATALFGSLLPAKRGPSGSSPAGARRAVAHSCHSEVRRHSLGVKPRPCSLQGEHQARPLDSLDMRGQSLSLGASRRRRSPARLPTTPPPPAPPLAAVGRRLHPARSRSSSRRRSHAGRRARDLPRRPVGAVAPGRRLVCAARRALADQRHGRRAGAARGAAQRYVGAGRERSWVCVIDVAVPPPAAERCLPSHPVHHPPSAPQASSAAPASAAAPSGAAAWRR